jgi:WD40 repeat protein
VQDPQYTQKIVALEFLPDGKRLVAINAKFGEVLVYDLEKGFSRTIGNHTPKDSARQLWDTFCMAVSPDGKQVASINSDETAVSVWDIEAKSRKMLNAEPISPTAITWSHNGKTIAVGRGTGDKRGAVLFDVSSGKATVLTNQQDDIIQSLAFSPDDKTLVVAGQNNGTVLWDLASNKPWQTLSQEKASSGFADTFSPDGTTLATDCDTLKPTCVRLWDVSERPGGSRGAGHLPAALDVKTYQDDQLTVGLENDLARTFSPQGAKTIKVSLQPDGALVLDGTVPEQRDKESATRIAENFYVGLKPDKNNTVINHLQVTRGSNGTVSR